MKKYLLFTCLFSFIAAGTNTNRYVKNNLAYTGGPTEIIRGNYQDWLPLRLQVSIDPTFNPEQRKILLEAIKIFMKRAFMDAILNCAFNNSYRDLPPSKKDFEIQLSSAMTPFHINGEFLPAFVFMSRYWEDSKSVLLSQKSLFYENDLQLPGFSNRHYLHIAINSDHIGNDSKYYYKEDSEYWSSVLARGFLRNLGYDDSKGTRGSFSAEYGRCIYINGTGY